MTQHFLAEWQGYCPICGKETTFRAENDWFRDHLLCTSCEGGSIPRERATMHVLEREYPLWRKARIHESSPVFRGVSSRLLRECPGYLPTYFFPGVTLGAIHNKFRCEDIENQTFADESFDIVITQDVMEFGALCAPAAGYGNQQTVCGASFRWLDPPSHRTLVSRESD